MISEFTSTELLDVLVKDEDGAVYDPYLFGPFLRARHFISAISKNKFYHEGIDGNRETITRNKFLRLYPDHLGKIWQIDLDEI